MSSPRTTLVTILEVSALRSEPPRTVTLVLEDRPHLFADIECWALIAGAYVLAIRVVVRRKGLSKPLAEIVMIIDPARGAASWVIAAAIEREVGASVLTPGVNDENHEAVLAETSLFFPKKGWSNEVDCEALAASGRYVKGFSFHYWMPPSVIYGVEQSDRRVMTITGYLKPIQSVFGTVEQGLLAKAIGPGPMYPEARIGYCLAAFGGNVEFGCGQVETIQRGPNRGRQQRVVDMLVSWNSSSRESKRVADGVLYVLCDIFGLTRGPGDDDALFPTPPQFE